MKPALFGLMKLLFMVAFMPCVTASAVATVASSAITTPVAIASTVPLGTITTPVAIASTASSTAITSTASFAAVTAIDANAAVATETEVTLTRHPGQLGGSLLVPESDAPVPVVLIVAGSGPTDRNGNQPGMENNSLKFVAHGLYAHNIASLRIDKRGVGASATAGIPEIELRFDHFVDDVVAWVEWLELDKRFSEIIIAGHSEGSLIGLLAANRSSTVRKFISLAGVGNRADHILREQLASQPDFVRSTAYTLLDSLTAGVTVDGVAPMFAPLFRESIQPYLISWFAYTPSDIIADTDIPVLVINGNTDIQVGVEEGRVLAYAGMNAEFIEIDQMNHVLKLVDEDVQRNIGTYMSPELPLHPDLIPIMVTFIRGR